MKNNLQRVRHYKMFWFTLLALIASTSAGTWVISASRNSAPQHQFLPVMTQPAAIWQPALGTTWQWQLSGLPVDLSVDVAMYDIDLFDNDAAVVAALHARGRKAICYMSAGSWEPGRPDSAQFSASIKGRALDGWPDERWLDIRRIEVLGPLMEARFDLCRAKGFDGVELDNVDAFSNASGFPLTAQDQIVYNTFLAQEAHARSLSVGLKNDLEQIDVLQPSFDWALNEQCFQYDECDALQAFIDAGKAVFQVEYDRPLSQFCTDARIRRFSSLNKHLSLNAFRQACDP